MTADFSIGDRVGISELGAARSPRLAERTGTIVGRGIYTNSFVVLFDGNKTTSTFHGDYLEAIRSENEERRKR
jgi:hypothetical protein